MPVAPTSSFPIPVAVDLDFRPDTNVADWCALAAMMQNVTGEWRRHELQAHFATPARPGEVRPRPLRDTLDAHERTRYVAAHPAVRCAGEFLPAYLPGELELATWMRERLVRLAL
jgi:hypothetical protein